MHIYHLCSYIDCLPLRLWRYILLPKS